MKEQLNASCLLLQTFSLQVDTLRVPSLFYTNPYHCSIIPTDEDVAALPHYRRDQLTLTQFLGSGAFGEVFEGLARNILSEDSGDTKVAVKVCMPGSKQYSWTLTVPGSSLILFNSLVVLDPAQRSDRSRKGGVPQRSAVDE